MSTVSYSVTNALSFDSMPAVSGAGEPTEIVVDALFEPSVSVMPGSASVTVFEPLVYCVPSTESVASSAVCVSANERPEPPSVVTLVIAAAVPVCLFEMTSVPLKMVAYPGLPAVWLSFEAMVESESPAAILTSVVPVAVATWMTSAPVAIAPPDAVN